MSYRDLYNYCQTLSPKISSKDIKDKVLELTGIGSVKVIATALDISKCRGFYLSATNTSHPLVIQNGGHIIALAREIQNPCWRRFVLVKELMHLFDNEQEATDSAEALDSLLTELSVDGVNRTAQFQSEINSFWMALAVLCPEQKRQEFETMRNAGHIDDYGIALQIRIPKQYVPLLFNPNFQGIVQGLLKVPARQLEPVA